MDVAGLIEGLEITRRSFLKLGLIAGAGYTLPKYLRSHLPDPFRDEVGPPPLQGPETWAPSVCTLCAAGCGTLVRVIEGKAVGIQGMPQHPVNRGKLCPKGLSGLQSLYHPDRLRGPARRVGQRHENRWEPVGWDEALQTVAERLQPLQRGGEPHRFGMFMGAATPLTRSLFERFGQAYGTPNIISLDWPLGQGPTDAFSLMHGSAGWNYDLSNTEYIMSFGLDWLQAFPSPVEASRAYGLLRRGRPDRRVRIIQIEPRRSVTGIKADVWVPVKPGTEGALALGIAHTLIAEGLYDKPFVEQHTTGFDDWTDTGGVRRAGFKSVVLNEYTLDAVTASTGIPGEMIVTLAREFAARKPALAMTDRLRPGDQMAVHSLNILTGNIGVAGGVISRASPPVGFASTPAVSGRPRVDGAGTPAFPLARHTPHHFPDIPAEAMPYALDTLMLYRANPLFLSPQPARWINALERAPFIVTLSSFLDETALFADLVLPESTGFEDWQENPTSTLEGIPVFSVGKPVVKPLYDTRHAGDVALEIARRLDLTTALPWENVEAVIHEGIRGVYEAGKGAPLGDGEEPPASLEDFRDMVIRSGGWADTSAATPAAARFDTPSGRIEWVPKSFQERSGADLSALLKPDAPGQDAAFPLYLCVYTPLAFAGGEGAHLPALQLIAGPYLRERWESWIEINPKTGERLGIRDGDSVWVESSSGKLQARARWFQGTRPDVVSMPFGLGHGAQGRWAEGIGASPGAIVANTLDPVSGHPLWQSTRVKVYKDGVEA